VVLELDAARERVSIGRRTSNDVALPWDGEVSRVHAELSCMGGYWVVCDEGMSRLSRSRAGDQRYAIRLTVLLPSPVTHTA
jgi:pSer/pThr/pTyr-binding forkhead associated (FHA) protein